MEKPYKPISCSFYDYLEAYIIEGSQHKVIYKSEQGSMETTYVKLKDLRTDSGEEFLYLENGTKLRLDKLIGIDEILVDQFPKTC
ncbi:hypothetical protein OO013_01670 [Mangrovivirga sp. M17]|uniref:Rho-binding antiterminator n=1 Tax=Mangrovivirga halotolerans TaxID=2993936 RepID=A0ABT3RM46_9BACT|nr:hypothetical protein [Mangrovivirga halotolerans]MCX2742551.1 hypothetical protein [Mangrovivirga halotolerans]